MGQGSFKQEKGSKTWSAQFSYKDYYGNTRRKHKRGFATKREAIQFRNEFVLKQQSNIDMSFASFIEESLTLYRNKSPQIELIFNDRTAYIAIF